MRSLGSFIFSGAFIAFGVFVLIWGATSLLGRAQSQVPGGGAPAAPVPPPVAAPAPTAAGPSAAPPAQAQQSADEPFTPSPNPDGYTYDPTGLRDPFKPFSNAPVTPSTPTKTVINSSDEVVDSADPLQNYELSQLKVVGIIWGVSKPKAMVRDPAGGLHLVYKESKIGRKNGFVAEIREGEVIVVEPTRSAEGFLTATPRVMALVR